MTITKTLRRQAARAAAQIHDQLTRLNSSNHWTELPQEPWDEAVRIARRLRFALARGWNTAARTLLLDLDYMTRQICRELTQFQSNLPQTAVPENVSRVHEIAADLVALFHEFPEVRFDAQQKTVSVVTEPIELEGVALGRFQIVLSWPDIGSKQSYEVVALDPCCAAEDEAVSHPHVQGQRLCEGEGSSPIRTALAEGRILDFFMLVHRVLETYNAGSAYVPLDRWAGVPCRECGWMMPAGGHGCCDECESPLCSDCSTSCQGCDKFLCRECLSDCPECGQSYCGNCLSPSGRPQQLVCDSCLMNQSFESQENQNDVCSSPATDRASANSPAETIASGAAPTADPLCLGQASVPP